MNLITYDKSGCGRWGERVPTIHIARSAAISFNKLACKLLQISEGDQIKFHREKDTRKWYVEKVTENGMVLKNYPSYTGLMIYAKSLADDIFTSYGISKPIMVEIKTDPVEGRLYPLDEYSVKATR